jgi:hypothetical protein
MRLFHVRTLCTVTGLFLATSTVQGQGATVTNPPNTQEFGLDAAAIIGLGDRSSVSLTLPAARARIGFFLNADSRWSVEPSAGLSYSKVKDVPYQLAYNLEVGMLYHMRPASDVYNATRASVAYIRPFIGITGVNTGGSDGADGGSNSELSAGAGYGIKIPWRDNLAWRLEANAGYGFDNKAFRVGAFAGLSFFARNLIPTGR